MKKNIQFYGANDLANHWDTDRVTFLLNKKDNDLTIDEILELIEAIKMKGMFNIKDELIKSCKTKAYKAFPKITDNNIGKYFSQIKIPKYRYNFFNMIENKQSYKNLSAKGFDDLLKSSGISLAYILPNEKLTNKWGIELYEWIKVNPDYIPFILNKYIDTERFNESWHLPAEINNQHSLQKLVEIYVNSSKVNPNVLENIVKSRNYGEFQLSDLLKFKAKEKYDFIENMVFTSKNAVKIISEVSFDDSKRWIKNNLDYPTLLNNFIYLFGFTDTQFRSRLISLDSQIGIFEALTHCWTYDFFKDSFVFKRTFFIERGLIQKYYLQLLNYGIRIEQIIGWFFNEYIPDEFNVSGFRFNVPSPDSTWLEKCRTLFSEMDSIIKQFNLYQKIGTINFGLLNISSKPIDISELNSFIPNKFVYQDKNGNDAIELLFSDQLFGNLTHKYKSKNFLDTIFHHSLQYDEFERLDIPSRDNLIKYHVLTVKNNKLILNNEYTKVLQDIYYHGEYVPYMHKSKKVNLNVSEMRKDRLIRYGSTLLAEPEIDFYYYICNKKKFTNGLDLRNKYIHGSNSNISEEEHESNFYIILLLFIQLIIRINEDLCWKDDHKNKLKK